MKPLVIYHANCTDGFGAAFAAWLKLGNEAEYLPMNYGEVKTPADFDMKVSLAAKDNDIYILDFSFPREVMNSLFKYAKRVVWLDHHKTAFEMWCGKYEQGMEFYDVVDSKHYIGLDDKRSGTMLAWHNFHPGTEAPMLIRHIDDYDRWQFKMDGSKEFHAALVSYQPWTFEQWKREFLPAEMGKSGLSFDQTAKYSLLQKEGTAILRAHSQNVQVALKQARNCVLDISIDGYRTYPVGLACNAPSFLASDLGHELANKSGTFGLVWSLAGDGQVHCSLRSNGEYDVSAIAKVFGGGGHRNAAGFSTNVDTLMSWLK